MARDGSFLLNQRVDDTTEPIVVLIGLDKLLTAPKAP